MATVSGSSSAYQALQMVRLPLPMLEVQNPDTLVYLGDHNVDKCLRVSSQKLLATGSPVFKTLLGPSKQYKVLRRKKLLRDGLPIGIKFAIDLSPPEEGEEAIEAVEALDLPECVVRWKSGVNSPFIEEDDDESVAAKWAQEHQLDPTILDSSCRLSRELQKFQQATLEALHARPETPGTSNSRNEDKDIDDPDNDGIPVYKNGSLDQKLDVDEESLAVQPPPVPLPPAYSQARHRAAIERLLWMLHDVDPQIRSSSMWYTVYKVSMILECGPSIRDYLMKWIFWDNILFVELFPRLVLQMADDIKASGLFRDAFALLVTGALTEEKATDARGIGFNELENCRIKWEKNIEEAQASFVTRVEEKYKYLHSLDWLYDLPCFARLNEVMDNPRIHKAFRATTETLTDTIKNELRHQLSQVTDSIGYRSEEWVTDDWELSLFQMIPPKRRRYSSYYWNQEIQNLHSRLSTLQVGLTTDWWAGQIAYLSPRVCNPMHTSKEAFTTESKGKGAETAAGDSVDVSRRRRIVDVRPALTRNNNSEMDGKGHSRTEGAECEGTKAAWVFDYENLPSEDEDIEFFSTPKRSHSPLPESDGKKVRLETDPPQTIAAPAAIPITAPATVPITAPATIPITAPATIPRHPEEQQRSQILPLRPAHQQFFSNRTNRRVSFASEATLHTYTWDYSTNEYLLDAGARLNDTQETLVGTSDGIQFGFNQGLEWQTENKDEESSGATLENLHVDFSLEQLCYEIKAFIETFTKPFSKNVLSWQVRNSQILCCLEESEWKWLPLWVLWAESPEGRKAPLVDGDQPTDDVNEQEKTLDPEPAESEAGSQFTLVEGSYASSLIGVESTTSTDKAVWSVEGSGDDRTWEHYKEDVKDVEQVTSSKTTTEVQNGKQDVEMDTNECDEDDEDDDAYDEDDFDIVEWG